ncbi:MbcA/ParS/Xre antitoxin family protein [Pseudomonas sp. B21-023]|uniref:MbcA/ParS/Xre antitoxin family protein n=1 Tax=unclassified Pseudomonas TaxID=196821 RepID=UPI001556DAE5|nr:MULTISPECIES: MbcA/ParS/Xre antitoxin family protein [unclassified Pseudomonas]NQD75321.1 DUF2384 domain-containing protein [Pseudomonas sp. CM27]UVM14350.1 MbcA/ParS/Xre antitoxin family protein [Pseudomonas sp. B21-023]
MQNFDLVWQKAQLVFGDKAKAAVWLSTPKHQFGDVAAIDYVTDQECFERVMEVLAQIDHGYV